MLRFLFAITNRGTQAREKVNKELNQEQMIQDVLYLSEELVIFMNK